MERNCDSKVVEVKTEKDDSSLRSKQYQHSPHSNPTKLATATLQHKQQLEETEANTDLSDLQLNNSIINVIEQHMPIELFMETPPLTGDSSSTHSTNSMCSSGGVSADSEPHNNNAALLALDADTPTTGLTTEISEPHFSSNGDADGERPLVLVIITDYDMQQ